MKIRLIGQANHTGIGIHFSSFCQALRRIRPDLTLDIVDGFDHAACIKAVLDSRPTDINICFIGSDMHRLQGRNIQWVPFETTRIPDMIVRPLLDCHEVWAMTAWARQVMIDNGIPLSKITIVPQGIDSDLWQTKKHHISDHVMQVLTVGKCEQRKGLHDLLQAWSRSLINDDRAMLTIKTHAGLQGDQGYHDLITLIQNLGINNYKLLWGVMEDQDLVDLYDHSDVFVLPTRGEGWGRPLMEAAAMALPIVTTKTTAHGEWLADIQDSVIWINHDMVSAEDKDYVKAYGQQKHWGQWARPCVDHLAEILRDLPACLSDLKATADTNAHWARQQYNWNNIARRAIDALRLS